MGKKFFLEKVTGKKSPVTVASTPKNLDTANQNVGDVDHLWMKEDINAQKPKLERNSRIDTVILRDRIADKIAKLNKD